MNYLIVDIKDSLVEIQKLHQLNILYDRFPLKDIISVILSVEQERDYGDILFFEMEKRLGDVIDVLDLDSIQIFIECLIDCVDECILSSLPINVNQSDYILENWLTDNTIVLKKIR